MAAIELSNVGLNYYAYGTHARSFKLQLVAAATGGRIKMEDKVVKVQALKDVSFSLKDGDRLGLIGHNGSGKTSLLKILAQIYEPSKGSLKISGTANCLFDITFGLDPLLSGYENIKLRGLMHGLSSHQIDNCIPDIVEFAELGGFIHLPLKSYSSGMLLRLAFGIVTSFAADILLIDEVVNVGDARFMSKAKDRMQKLIDRTGILVLSTHDRQIINEFCNVVLELDHGGIKFFGPKKNFD